MALLLRRRSLLLKIVLLIFTAWFTVAFLLYMEQRGSPADSNAVVRPGDSNVDPALPHPAALSKKIPDSSSEKGLPAVVPSGNQNAAPEVDAGPEEGVGGVLVPPRDPDEDSSSVKYGEMGKPVVLPTNMSADVKKLVDEGWQKNAFNQYVSDLISVRRKLPDPRDQWCKEPSRYLENLPATAVVICFHNEAWSVLLRTVHSVIDRSPPHLLKEVILVDDYSDMPHTKRQLEDYMVMYPKVKIVRATKREGLIRARLLGARHATAPVLTYLDSHCECTTGWLEPLLDRIARDPTTVVCPVIDVIDDTSLEYHWRDSGGVNVGGFDWNLQFNWHAVPERERKKHKNSAEPVWSPTMAGGLFSIDKAFFEKLGTYDSGFDIWGGENLELSFKTWMCGGTLEIVPCSHVGHIFRKRSPYKWRSGVNVLKRNSVRLAEVWLDDYAKYYYQRIGNDLGDFGDVSSRRELREKLGCKSFKWYLDNIYPELFIPGEAVAYGEVINVLFSCECICLCVCLCVLMELAVMNQVRNLGLEGKTCLDSPARKADLHKAAGLYPCHNQGGNQIHNEWSGQCVDSACKPDDMHKPVGLWPCHMQGGNQYWMMSKAGEIRRDETCLDYAGQDVILYPCHGSKGNQYWHYNPETRLIQHGSSKKCLAISSNKQKLLMEECDNSNQQQQWKFQNYNPSKL
ncbi:Putative polypeptide N-acetylgalactosaminyltransferase 9 [Zootermopsis nevadensis]|uniref:Polypeptide N-acetylgalactosaminyltransferase n=1 Tax=Zootermopsis nevadensis TaxID=136037 RepID=A0A067RJ22_ZOONE|nr:Putative polypeptide N-acetylgalactosaminyltransferase 9 [Zootermopsis nevadensis]